MTPFLKANPEAVVPAMTIFVNFIVRDGFMNRRQATAEVVNLISKAETRDNYFEMSRKGYTKALTRKERAKLWLFWENAQNHACFEVGLA